MENATISAKIPAELKAKLLNEAKRNDLTLSQYVSFVLSIDNENQRQVERLQNQVADLESRLQDKKQTFTTEAVNCNLDTLLGLQDTLAEMQSQLQELYDNQPQDLKERIEELEEEIEELREEQNNRQDEEDEEDEDWDFNNERINMYREIGKKLREEILQLKNQNETDCAKFQKLGEEAMAKIAMNQFAQVADMVAQDYRGKDKIKGKMWAIFRGLPDPKHAWYLVENPYSVIKNK